MEPPLALDVILQAASTPLRAVELHSRIDATGADLLSAQDLTALRLVFSDASVWILCVGATDEVHVSLTAPPWPAATVSNLTATDPWLACHGRSLLGAALVTNTSGYTDAVQLQFGEPGANARARVQVEAVASRFWFWKLVGPMDPQA